MKFFHAIKEILRDKGKDKLCASLRDMGLDARMAEQGRPEEHAVGRLSWVWTKKSLGLIEIHGEPIRWINVVQQISTDGEGGIYITAYIVPDPRVSLKGHIEPVRVRNRLRFGQVIDLRWKGDLPSEFIKRMNENVPLNQKLIRQKDYVTIYSYPKHGCWAIFPRRGGMWHPPIPSQEQWDCYKTIAHHLLESGGK